MQTQMSLKEAIAQGAAAVEGNAGYAGRLNIYACEKCRGHIVTRDLHAGVTPFMLRCHATDGCAGMMKSSLYRVFDQSVRETHQWVRPAEGDDVDPRLFGHIAMGGLILRQAPASEAAA